ncbi:UNVERIFIED_CONTAM: hypothetical protein FKN15_005610 [Acipenser sinensis]
MLHMYSRSLFRNHLTLSKEANWTVNGVVLPADAKRGTTKPNLSLRMRKLSEKTTVRILVFKNGAGQDGCEVIAAVDQTEKVYENGQDTEETVVYINRKLMEKGCGKDVQLMMDRLLQIVGQRLQSSQMYNPSGLNLFPTRLFDEQGQEICNPCSLQNEQKVWVSYGEDYRSPYNPVLSLPFDRLLQIVGQRLQSSQMYNPSGLNLFPTRLFDEQGQEICNPCSLQNEQKVWVSYGEDYRSTYNPVLSLTFDRLLQIVGQRLQSSQMYNPSGLNLFPTRLFDEQGQEICNPCSLQNEQKVWVSYGEDYRWEAFIGFPENYSYEQQGSHHQQEDVDLDSHFIQLKEDLQMVLYASVTMENRSRKATRKKDNQNQMNAAAATTWPLAHVWMVTKGSKALKMSAPRMRGTFASAFKTLSVEVNCRSLVFNHKCEERAAFLVLKSTHS